MWTAIELVFSFFSELIVEFLIYKVICEYPLRCLLVVGAILTVFWMLYC